MPLEIYIKDDVWNGYVRDNVRWYLGRPGKKTIYGAIKPPVGIIVLDMYQWDYSRREWTLIKSPQRFAVGSYSFDENITAYANIGWGPEGWWLFKARRKFKSDDTSIWAMINIRG
jgi:hypothetical protein